MEGGLEKMGGYGSVQGFIDRRQTIIAYVGRVAVDKDVSRMMT